MLIFVKKIKRFFSLKRHLLLLALAAAVSSVAGYGVFSQLEKDVVINDDGSVITCKTMKIPLNKYWTNSASKSGNMISPVSRPIPHWTQNPMNSI